MKFWNKRWRDVLHVHTSISILNRKSDRIFLIVIITINFFYIHHHILRLLAKVSGDMALTAPCDQMRGWVGVGEFCFCFYDCKKIRMQCNFLLLKLNMPNEFFVLFLFLQKLKRNESTREENNAYLETSPTTAQKSDEPQYCNKNVVVGFNPI